MSAKPRPPYIGYHDKPEDWTDVTKVSERIHRLRRQIALHSYVYYELDETLITDWEYELRILRLIELQLRFPKISASIPFMKKAFLEDDFESTSYHIGNTVARSNSKDAISIRHRAGHLVKLFHASKDTPFESPGIRKKIGELNKRISTLKQVGKR